MQTRELILLLLLVLLVAVVIAVVVRRGSAKRDEEHRAEAQQMGTQAAWLESVDEPTKAAVAAERVGEPAAAGAAAADAPAPAIAVDAPEAAPAEVPAEASTPSTPELPLTRAERRLAREAQEAREAAEIAQVGPPLPDADAALETQSVVPPSQLLGTSSEGAAPDADAEGVAAAAGFRDEVPAHDPLFEDIAIPANEWGGPREDALALEPTVENPVEDDLPAQPVVVESPVVVEPVVAEPVVVEPVVAEPMVQEPEVAEPVVVEPTVEEPVVAEPTVENPVEDDLPAQPVDAEPTVEEPDVAEHTGRRISGFLEVRDGGFGVGSAAPIVDGAQPLDHPVQAYRDTMTFRVPGDERYNSAEPDVWFYDAAAAERSGFRPSQG